MNALLKNTLLLTAMLSPAMVMADAAQPLTNAASLQYGVKVSVEAGNGARKDSQTEPMMTFDGSAHTRQVMSGAPYSFTIELADQLPVEKIEFTQSDAPAELAPKDIEIVLEDGTKIPYTLAATRPEKGKLAWQDVSIGKTVKIIRVNVLTNYQPDPKVTWGGLGDIAVLTTANLKEKFAVAGYDANTPVFVNVPALSDEKSTTRPVNLPPVVAAGDHPRLLLGKGELAEFKASLDGSEEGKKAKGVLIGIADQSLTGPLDFPDPKGPPAQLRDRGDAPAKKHDRLAAMCGNLGMAYAITGDEKYAARATEILKGYAERYADYAEHKGANPQDTGKVMAQRLSEAMWLIPLIEGFDYVYDSKSLTDADRKTISNDLIRAGITFIRKKTSDKEAADRTARASDWRTAMPALSDGKPQGNWLLFYNAATMMAGATLGDQDMIDLATADFKGLIRKGIGSDGMWGEGAIGYQFFAINALISGVETAARQGIDLYSFDHSRLKMLFDSPLRFAYPDASAPGINDSVRVKFGDWSTECYNYAWLRYGDPAYAVLVNSSPKQIQFTTAIYYPTRVFTEQPEPDAITYPSTVFDNLGYAVLRSPQSYVLMKYGQHGGVHGHYDKLNLLLFAVGDNGKGDEMGGEPGFHRYEDPLHNQWTSTSIAHNTLTVNERSQGPATGKLLIFQDTPDVKVIRAEAVDAYPGVILDRTAVQTGDMVVDLYTGRSATQKSWDRTFRYQGMLDAMPAVATAATKTLGGQDGYQHIKVAATIPAQEAWKGAWQTKVGKFNVLLAGAAEQQVVVGLGPDTDQLAIARQKGDHAAFAAVYQMAAWGNPAQSAEWITADHDAHAIKITQADGAETLVVTGTGAGWSAGGWNSDARVLCVRKIQDRYHVLLCGGTFAKGPGGEMTLPAAGSASAEGSKGSLTLGGSHEVAP